MRIKVESTPPLTTFKAWFVVSAASNVQDLKESLCSDVPALREHEVAADQIALVLDGFELLDSSPIDVVRDGDLVNVKQRAPSSNVAHKKRKAESPEALPPPKRAKSAKPTKAKSTTPHAKSPARRAPSTSASSSSDSSSDSDDSSDDSTSSSDDSDSDSDSTSDDSSDSSSDSPPSVETSKARPALPVKTAAAKASANATAAVKPKPVEIFTPPGQGKTATKNRNLRRRLKKHHERLATEQASNGVFGVNNVPLGSRAIAVEQDIEASFDNASHDDVLPASPQVRAIPPTIMMASLSNKNKRKGFKQAMASALPKKIVFAAPDAELTPPESEPAPLPFQAASSSEVTAAAPNIFPRLIPPSEKQQNGQIPSNMIVTSIDVEEGLCPERKNKGKGKKKAEARSQLVRSETQEVERVVLDYGEADDGEMEDDTGNDDMIPTQRTVAPEPELGKDANATEHSDLSPRTWALVEKKWETLPKIQDAKSAVTGSLVGWKALALNPATFTPEILLNIGRVQKNDPDLNLVVQPLLRPGAAQSQVSFGGRLDVYEDEGDGEEVEVVVPEEETYEWNEVFSGDWRVLTGLEL